MPDKKNEDKSEWATIPAWDLWAADGGGMLDPGSGSETAREIEAKFKQCKETRKLLVDLT